MGNTALSCGGVTRKGDNGSLDGQWALGNDEAAPGQDEAEAASVFVRAERDVSPERMKELHEMLRRVDGAVVYSGTTERPELVKLLKALYEPTEAEVAEFRRRFDSDGNGTLNEEEFAACVRHHNGARGELKFGREIHTMFGKHCNENGVIDDLPAVIRELLVVPPAVQRRAAQILDAHGGTSATLDEFTSSHSGLVDALELMWIESRKPAIVEVVPPPDQRNASDVLTPRQKRRMKHLKQQARRRRASRSG